MSLGVVFDHHALGSVGAGHRQLSGLIAKAHQDALFSVAVPALALAEAVRQRPAVSTHVAQLAALEVHAFDRIAADLTGRIANSRWPDEGWPVLHAVAVSLTTGWEIITTRPSLYQGFGAPVLPVAE